jgi:hypothetical protein
LEIEIELKLRATDEQIGELGLQRNDVGHAPDGGGIAAVEQRRHVPGVAAERTHEIGPA